MSVWMQNPKPYGPAAGPIFQTLYQQPGVFAGALSDNYGAMAGGLATTGKSFSDAFGAYSAGLGSMATARANENAARYGANAMAEAARQGAVANLGGSALGAYGSAANSALNAWAANQQAYNRSAADMHMANQQALGNVGVSRNAALGGIGRAQLGADALANMNFSMSGGDGGFGATGTTGPIAGGSYGGGLQFSGSGSRSSGSALAGLSGAQDVIMNPDVLDRIDRAAQAGRDQLDGQHYSSRAMSPQMLGQTLSGLMTLGAPAYEQLDRGMNQFYANTQPNERPYESMLAALTKGYGTAGGQIGGVQRDINRGFGEANSGIGRLWDKSLGKLPEFQTPAEREISAREGRLEKQRSQDIERLSRLERLAKDPLSPYRSYYERKAAAQREKMSA